MVYTKSLKGFANNKLQVQINAWENRQKELAQNETGLNKLDQIEKNNKERKSLNIHSLPKNPIKFCNLYKFSTKISSSGSIKFKINEKHPELSKPPEHFKLKETHKNYCKEFTYNDLYRSSIIETDDDVFELNENESVKYRNNKINENDSDKHQKIREKENGSVKCHHTGIKEFNSVKYRNNGIKIKSINDKFLPEADSSNLSMILPAKYLHLENKSFINDNNISDFLIENMQAATISCKERRTRSEASGIRSAAPSSTKLIRKPFEFKNQFRSFSYSESDSKKVKSNNQNRWNSCQDEIIYQPCETRYSQNDKFSSEEPIRLSSPLKQQQIFYQECTEVETKSSRSSSTTESDNQHYRPQLGNLTVVRRCSAPAVLNADTFLATRSRNPSVDSIKSNNRRKNCYIDEENNNIVYEFQKSLIDEENHFKVIQDNFQSLLFNKCASENKSLKKSIDPVFNRNFISDKAKLMEDIRKSRRKLSQQRDHSNKQVSNVEITPQPRTRKFSLPEISYNSSSKKDDDDDDDDESHINYSSKAKKKLFNDFLTFKRKSADDSHIVKKKTFDDYHLSKINDVKQNNVVSRKYSFDSRKYSFDSRTPETERKISLSESFKSAMFRRTSQQEERKISHDENNNEKRVRKDSIKRSKKEKQPAFDETNTPTTTYKNQLPTNNAEVKTRKNAIVKSIHNNLSNEVKQNLDLPNTNKKQDNFHGFVTPPFETWSNKKIKQDTLPLLHIAASEGNLELLNTLYKIGVDINELDDSGWPALHYAVCSGNFQAAQILIEYGALIKDYSLKVTNNYCATVRNCIQTSHIEMTL